MTPLLFHGGTIVVEDGLLPDGQVQVNHGRIAAVHCGRSSPADESAKRIDLAGGYLAPGYVDLHVHGGAGADFMDGTEAAFQTICAAHARHGTTSLLPTTTVARHEQHLVFLNLCRRLKNGVTRGARILGAHFYG